MAFIDSLSIFIANLIIGGIGIFIGAKVITGRSDFSYALMTALLGAIVWSIVSFFLGGFAFVGALITLFAWIAVINSRYAGGWINAILIGFASWLAVLATLIVLSWVGITGFTAIGVPIDPI